MKSLKAALKPSSDTPTHRLLRTVFPTIGGIVHTHSRFTRLSGRRRVSRSRRREPPMPTHFYGTIPCTANDRGGN
ncbi:class II aldolase/adducin family protein [Salmonella enterica subsp. enterica]|nr:class II aldolase/adducin family protein [Salmonella enterica subsp. enterica]